VSFGPTLVYANFLIVVRLFFIFFSSLSLRANRRPILN
jgi:hypothetical protein